MALRKEYPKTVGPAAMPTGVAASVYQAPERVTIRQFTLSNTTAGNLAATIHKVSATGSAAVGNQILPALVIPANDVLVVAAPLVLEGGERIFALAAGAINLTFIVNDRETEVL